MKNTKKSGKFVSLKKWEPWMHHNVPVKKVCMEINVQHSWNKLQRWKIVRNVQHECTHLITHKNVRKPIFIVLQAFCRFDDYNWDWSLQFTSFTCVPGRLKVMLSKSPRIFHIGEWLVLMVKPHTKRKRTRCFYFSLFAFRSNWYRTQLKSDVAWHQFHLPVLFRLGVESKLEIIRIQ